MTAGWWLATVASALLLWAPDELAICQARELEVRRLNHGRGTFQMDRAEGVPIGDTYRWLCELELSGWFAGREPGR